MNHPQLAEMEAVRAVIEKLTVIANAEAGCEQSNRKYNLMKNDLSHRMQIPMIKARMRVGSNGPPLHLFDATLVFEHWKRNGHRLALKVHKYSTDDSQVIKRIREESAKAYTCNIFVKQNYFLKVILLHETRKSLPGNGKFPREFNDFRVNKF